jgi:hypothetical protein
MPILKNQKHERFAQLLATGMSASEAYTKVYKKKGKVAGSAGGRLLKNVGIQQRLAELQQKAETAAVLTLADKREFLRRVVVTSIGEVDEKSPLCQSAEYSEDGRKFKMPDKLKAIELDAKLAGEFREQVEVKVDGLGELLKAIRGGKQS